MSAFSNVVGGGFYGWGGGSLEGCQRSHCGIWSGCRLSGCLL